LPHKNLVPLPLFDTDHVEALLQASAAAGQALTYTEALNALGHPFSRPRMRALCAVLDEADRRAAAAGQPELAVLVVRASDGLPGQGWWVGRSDHQGPWEGPHARAHVDKLQRSAFAYWSARRPE
jgi:hypothetical protein